MVLMMIMVQQMKIMILLFIKNDMLFIDKTTGRGWEISPSVVLGVACGGRWVEIIFAEGGEEQRDEARKPQAETGGALLFLI